MQPFTFDFNFASAISSIRQAVSLETQKKEEEIMLFLFIFMSYTAFAMDNTKDNQEITVHCALRAGYIVSAIDEDLNVICKKEIFRRNHDGGVESKYSFIKITPEGKAMSYDANYEFTQNTHDTNTKMPTILKICITAALLYGTLSLLNYVYKSDIETHEISH